MTQEYNEGPHQPAFFKRWQGQYDDAEMNYRLPLRRQAELKDELATANDVVEAIKAEVVMNGGADVPDQFGVMGWAAIDGSNDAKRAAQLLVICEKLPAFLDARSLVREKQLLLSKVANEMTEYEHAMRGARLALEYGTSWLFHRAAAEGARGAERKT